MGKRQRQGWWGLAVGWHALGSHTAERQLCIESVAAWLGKRREPFVLEPSLRPCWAGCSLGPRGSGTAQLCLGKLLAPSGALWARCSRCQLAQAGGSCVRVVPGTSFQPSSSCVTAVTPPGQPRGQGILGRCLCLHHPSTSISHSQCSQQAWGCPCPPSQTCPCSGPLSISLHGENPNKLLVS